MYARLRGVPDNKIKDVVSHAVQIVHLKKWADSLCGNYRYGTDAFTFTDSNSDC